MKGKLMKRLHSFADKVSGVSHVDNTTDPASAYSQMMRKQKNTLPRPAQDALAKKVK